MNNLSIPVFPSFQDPDKGSKKWIKKFVKACWSDFLSINTNSFYNGRLRYNNIKLYMLGEQPMEPYLQRLDVDIANSDKSWLKSVNKPLPIVTKYARMAKSTLKKSAYNVKLTSIDALSREEKNDYYIKNAALIQLRDIAKQNGVDPDYFDKVDRGFKDIEELELFMEHGYKSQFEIQGEEAIKLVLSNCNHGLVRDKNIEQLHDYGFVGYKDYFDINGDIRSNFVDVRDFIVSRCKFEDFSDAFYMGQVLDVTIGEFLEMDLEHELTADDKLELTKLQSSNTFTYSTNPTISPDQYESQRIRVLDIEFKSVDCFVLEETTNKLGNSISVRKRDKSKVAKGNDYIEQEYNVIFEAKWVIGTNVFIGCKKQTNMKRAKSNLSDVKFSFNCFAPFLNNMETKSLAEIYIPVVDVLTMSWLKYQHVINTAKSRGLLIDITSLENVPIGSGGELLTPLDNLKFYEKKGSLFYRSINEEGKVQNKPITELANGLGTEAQSYFAEIQNQIALLQQLSGYNELTDGSTPDSRTLNGVAKIASESTNNSIDFLKSAERHTFEALCYGILLRIQDAAEMGTLKNYVNAIGMESVKFFEVSPELSARELGIIIEDKPSEFEKESLNKLIEVAIAQSQITIADSFVIKNIESVKHAEAVLAYKVRQNMDKQQEIQLQNSEMNAKIQKESLMMASETKIAELREESNLKMQEMEKKKQDELELIKAKGEIELQLKTMEVTGRITQNKDIANAKIYAADRDADTKKEINEKNIAKENLHKAVEVEENSMAEEETD